MTLKELDYTITFEDPALGRVTAKSGWSAFSYGEIIAIHCSPQGADTVVTISSQLKVSANVFAGGRNQEHIDRILSRLAQRLGAEGHISNAAATPNAATQTATEPMPPVTPVPHASAPMPLPPINPKQKWSRKKKALVALAIVLPIVGCIAMASSISGTASGVDHVRVITSDPGMCWTGSLGGFNAGGSSQNSTEGCGTATFAVNGDIVSVVFQKKDTSGTLTVQLLHGETVLKEESTTASYGVVSVAK